MRLELVLGRGRVVHCGLFLLLPAYGTKDFLFLTFYFRVLG